MLQEHGELMLFVKLEAFELRWILCEHHNLQWLHARTHARTHAHAKLPLSRLCASQGVALIHDPLPVSVVLHFAAPWLEVLLHDTAVCVPV